MRRWIPLVVAVLALACGDDGPVRPATVPEAPAPPVILSVAFAPDPVLTDTVSVAVSAERADSVSLWVDGVPAAADTTAPFLLLWDSRAAVNGDHELMVRAANVSGRADTTMSRLVLNPGRGAIVSVSPADTLLASGASTRFTAVVLGENDTRVTWSVEVAGEVPIDAGPGSVDGDGLYTAPELVPERAEVRVRATSVADPSASAAARVTFDQPIRLVILSIPHAVRIGQKYPLEARLYGSAYDAVQWFVLEGSSHGTVDESGLYTAPNRLPDPPRVTFVVRGLYYPTLADTTESVPVEQPALISFVSLPSTVLLGREYRVVAEVRQTTDHRIRYSIDEGPAHGVIDESGLYTAPASRPVPSQVTFRATSLADTTVTASATIPIHSTVAVSIPDPPAWTLADGTTAFSAAVTGTDDTRVRWSVDEGPSHGTIDQDGVYTGPAARPDPPQATIRATSLADTLESAAVSVIVYGPVSVHVIPDSTAALLGDPVRFTATVANTPPTAIVWSVDGGAAFGVIDNKGNYTTPWSLPDPARAVVRATSTVDPTATDEATVRLIGVPGVGELERLSDMYLAQYGVVELAEQVTGIVGTALGMARYLAKDEEVHCGTLVQHTSEWSFYPDEGNWLEVSPRNGPYVLIEFATIDGAVPSQDAMSRFLQGAEFKGELDCTIQVGQRGPTLRLTNSSTSLPEPGKPACPCPGEAAFVRTLQGRIPGSEGGTWDLDVTLRGEIWDCYDAWSNGSSGVNQSLSGTFTTPGGVIVAVEDMFSRETATLGYQTTSVLWSFDGGFSATDPFNSYVWSGISFFWSWSNGAPRDLEAWHASGTVLKDGTPYGTVRFDRPVGADMTEPARAVADFGPESVLGLDQYRFHFYDPTEPVPNPFVSAD